jgi:hypothetical protein
VAQLSNYPVRRVLIILAAVPFGGAATLWVVSQFRPSGFSLADPAAGATQTVWTSTFVSYEEYYDLDVTPSPLHVDVWVFVTGRRAMVASARSEGQGYDVRLRYCRYSVLFVPRLLFGTSLGALPLIVMIANQLRRRQDRNEGVCRVCGYDLRATPERCPECGTIHSVVVCVLNARSTNT